MRRKLRTRYAVLTTLAVLGVTAASAWAFTTTHYSVSRPAITGTLAGGPAVFTSGPVVVSCTTSTSVVDTSAQTGTLGHVFTFSTRPTFSGCSASISGVPKSAVVTTFG